MDEKKLGKLIDSLAFIGTNEKLRYKFIELCREAEECFKLENRSVRDEVTAPIIDALHTRVAILKKNVKPGIVFNYAYTSKISRELVMSIDSQPDHIWEPQTTKLLVHFSNNVDHVLIGGAYFGDQAIIVAKKMNKKGALCHTFEANRDSFKMLELNAKSNNLSNMVLNCIGLWADDNTNLVLIGDDEISAHPEVLDKNNITSESISTVSINTYGHDHNINNMGLIMLDIEGGEYEVFRGADRYLSQPPDKAPILIFEVHRHYNDWSEGLENTNIVKLLKEFGYQSFAIRDYQGHVPMGNNPVELIPLERTYLEGPPHGFNMLALKDETLIRNDLFRICYDVSPKLLIHKNPELHHPIHFGE